VGRLMWCCSVLCVGIDVRNLGTVCGETSVEL